MRKTNNVSSYHGVRIENGAIMKLGRSPATVYRPLYRSVAADPTICVPGRVLPYTCIYKLECAAHGSGLPILKAENPGAADPLHPGARTMACNPGWRLVERKIPSRFDRRPKFFAAQKLS